MANAGGHFSSNTRGIPTLRSDREFSAIQRGFIFFRGINVGHPGLQIHLDEKSANPTGQSHRRRRWFARWRPK